MNGIFVSNRLKLQIAQLVTFVRRKVVGKPVALRHLKEDDVTSRWLTYGVCCLLALCLYRSKVTYNFRIASYGEIAFPIAGGALKRQYCHHLYWVNSLPTGDALQMIVERLYTS